MIKRRQTYASGEGRKKAAKSSSGVVPIDGDTVTPSGAADSGGKSIMGLLRRMTTRRGRNSTSSRSSTASAASSSALSSGPTSWLFGEEDFTPPGINYTIKYLGSELVSDPRNDELVLHRLEEIRFVSYKGKNKHKRPVKAFFNVSLSGVTITNAKTGIEIATYPVARVRTVNAGNDKAGKLFALIVKDEDDSVSTIIGCEAVKASQVTVVARSVAQLFEVSFQHQKRLSQTNKTRAKAAAAGTSGSGAPSVADISETADASASQRPRSSSVGGSPTTLRSPRPLSIAKPAPPPTTSSAPPPPTSATSPARTRKTTGSVPPPSIPAPPPSRAPVDSAKGNSTTSERRRSSSSRLPPPNHSAPSPPSAASPANPPSHLRAPPTNDAGPPAMEGVDDDDDDDDDDNNNNNNNNNGPPPLAKDIPAPLPYDSRRRGADRDDYDEVHKEPDYDHVHDDDNTRHSNVPPPLPRDTDVHPVSDAMNAYLTKRSNQLESRPTSQTMSAEATRTAIEKARRELHARELELERQRLAHSANYPRIAPVVDYSPEDVYKQPRSNHTDENPYKAPRDATSSRSYVQDDENPYKAPRDATSSRSYVQDDENPYKAPRDASRSYVHDDDNPYKAPRDATPTRSYVQDDDNPYKAPRDASQRRSHIQDDDNPYKAPRDATPTRSYVQDDDNPYKAPRDASQRRSHVQDDDNPYKAPRDATPTRSYVQDDDNPYKAPRDATLTRSYVQDDDNPYKAPRDASQRRSHVQDDDNPYKAPRDATSTRSYVQDDDNPYKAPRISRSYIQDDTDHYKAPRGGSSSSTPSATQRGSTTPSGFANDTPLDEKQGTVDRGFISGKDTRRMSEISLGFDNSADISANLSKWRKPSQVTERPFDKVMESVEAEEHDYDEAEAVVPRHENHYKMPRFVEGALDSPVRDAPPRLEGAYQAPKDLPLSGGGIYKTPKPASSRLQWDDLEQQLAEVEHEIGGY